MSTRICISVEDESCVSFGAGSPLITNYGGKGDGITDNTAAFNAAIAANPGHACVVFPSGTYNFLSALSFTAHTATETISIVGSGMGNTVLTWPNSVGTALTITEISPSNGVHIRDLTMTTGQNKLAVGLLINSNYAPGAAAAVNQAQSDITNVDLHGSDGYAKIDQWSTAIHLSNVGGFAINNVNIFGGNGAPGWATSDQGNGIVVEGTTANVLPVVVNIAGLSAVNLDAGVLVGNNVQGVFIGGGSNFTGCNSGILVPSSSSGYSQLIVADSQFNSRIAINLLSPVPGLFVHSNLFIQQVVTSGNPPIGINLATSNNSIINSNVFIGTGNGGIAVSAGANDDGAIGGMITGNTIVANTIGIRLLPDAKLWTVATNTYFANASNVVSDVGKNAVDIPLDCTDGISLAFGGTSVGVIYGAKGGSYFQIGKEVTVNVTFGLTSKGSEATGAATIEGLPVPATALNESGEVQFGFMSDFLSLVAGLTGTVPQNTNRALILIPGTTGTSAAADTNFTNSTSFTAKIKYRVD